ncbi:hypothetical protein OC25_00975 [Pedobacter kyungheensis]|uniref:Uncharacterized protein n=1 Tax=Pedobacter kyungheensis TaxID=1069985 RepID=A0A0C1FWW1_9SPHI|nr:hypothetical protein [Pedobacter kyungheensis]KIA96368.1 hypothetical protein OC25_00975 [Pedobacter kyungheensis]
MSGTESGYTKNAANLNDLIIRLKTLGPAYQPPKDHFKIEALEKLAKEVEETNRILSKVSPVYSKAVDDQELIFKQLNNLITRSYNYVKVATDNPSELNTAKTLADKLRGVVKKSTSSNAAADGTKLPSQAKTSYDNRIEHLKQYIDVLSTSQVYKPAEEDLSIASLQTQLEKMQSSVNNVALIKPDIDDARRNRFNIFYDSQNNLIDTVQGVKTYIKASLKNDHPEKKYILGIPFKRLKM